MLSLFPDASISLIIAFSIATLPADAIHNQSLIATTFCISSEINAPSIAEARLSPATIITSFSFIPNITLIAPPLKTLLLAFNVT